MATVCDGRWGGGGAGAGGGGVGREKGSSSFISPALDGSEGGRKKPPSKSLHFPTIACVRAGKIHEKMFLKRKAHCNHALLSP